MQKLSGLTNICMQSEVKPGDHATKPVFEFSSGRQESNPWVYKDRPVSC